MSSATVNMFVSLILAMIGAAGFAFILTHPGIVASATSRFLKTANLTWPAHPAPPPAKREQASNANRASGTTAIAAGYGGHFLTTAEINGRSINVMVDTGASLVALTYDDAANLGIYVRPSDFTYEAQTANGIARVAPVTIPKISIGDISVRDVRGVVTERGKSDRTLLGMSFLGRLSRVEMRGGTLVLQE